MSVGFVAKCSNLFVYKSAHKGHASVYSAVEPPFNFPQCEVNLHLMNFELIASQ